MGVTVLLFATLSIFTLAKSEEKVADGKTLAS